MEMISVAVVDDHPLFRDGVIASLKMDESFVVTGQGVCAEEAIQICADKAPEVLLLDLNMPGICPIEAIRTICRDTPCTKVVVLTAMDSEASVAAALDAGARGYILKGTTAQDLMGTIREVHRGKTYVSPVLAGALITQMNKRLRAPAKDDINSLSRRETQILDKVALGLTNKEIAIELGISEKTVKHYMTRVMHKLDVRNRVEAALVARGGKPGS
jgi:DNA-binding NarL/FixJ family response regulator